MANRTRDGSARTPTFLRELYNPPGIEPTVDIVFVHGLNPLNTQDFAEKTWTHVNGTLWPRDILPSNIPDCRILLFGYNSNVAFDVSNQGIKDHANTLLDRLSRNRKVTEKSKTRPIIFVGHSLGGLVIKQALINATNNYEEYGVIKEATRGLVFFGTPHRGGNGASLGQVAANIITAVSGADRNDILRSLSGDSILTKNSNDDFRHQSERYRVLTFYETRKTKVDRWLSGIFGCVFNAIVVDADSAKLGLAGARENQLPIDADHSGICKFESADDRYEPVGGLIEQLVERIIKDKTELEESVLPRDSGVSAFKTLLSSSRLSLERSPNFSGREHEINRIHEHLTTLPPSIQLSRRVVVLHGLGGIGKTEIALAYASKYRHEYTAVFWIDATNSQTATLGLFQIVQGLINANITDEHLTIGCETIARRLGISGLVQEDGLLNSNLVEADKERIIKAAKRLVETEENRNVLIIYDNYDDIESYDLFPEFSPYTGNILITSRRKEAVYPHGMAVEVEGIEEEDGIKLLLSTSQYLGFSRSGSSPRDFEGIEEVREIVNLLERLPLAIEIAGAYILRTRLNPRQFLETLKNYKSRILQEIPRGALKRYGKNVYASWDMSFNDLKDKNPNAIKLLLFCTFMYHGEISLKFLRRGCRQHSSMRGEGEEETPPPLKWLKSILEDDVEFQKATADLFSYSLARPIFLQHLRDNLEEDDIVFSIHPLVHFWAHEKLVEGDRVQYFISSVLLLSFALWLPDTTEGIIAKRNALSHLEAGFQNFSHMREARQVRAHRGVLMSLTNIGEIFLQHGYYLKMMKLAEYVVDAYEEMFGLEHPVTLGMVNNLAISCQKQGYERYPEAESLYKRALAGQEKLLGPDHFDTLATVNNLSNLCFELGQERYPEAESLYKRALAGREKLLGPDHIDTLVTVYNLAILCSESGQERYPEAESLYKRALAGQEKVLGPDHIDTLGTVHNLANLYSKSGQERYPEAESLYKRALAGREKVLGPDHIDTLARVNNLANLCFISGQERYPEAESLYKRALAGREKVLGPDHIDTLRTVDSLAIICRKSGQERYPEAESLYKWALAGREKVLGPDHIDTRIAMYNLACLYVQLGQERYPEAESLYKRVLAGKDKVLGPDRISTLTAGILANIYTEQKRYPEAHALMTKFNLNSK